MEDELIIIKEDGYVDTDNLMSGLIKAVELLQEGYSIIAGINSQLGADCDNNNGKPGPDFGKTEDPFEVIRHCRITGYAVQLPRVQLNKKTYAQVKKLLEDAGADWVGNKTQAFVFPFNPDRVMAELRSGKAINLRQDYQFFETPDDLADWIVSLANVSPGNSILEPSAGRGAIIRAIHRIYPGKPVDCYEIMPENREFLLQKTGVHLIGSDFIAERQTRKYDRIIANPPFCNNQDMVHVRKMYDCLNDGGRLVSITGTGYTFRGDKKASEFRDWLSSVNAEYYPIEKGRFKESGTSIGTYVIIINN